MCKRFLGCVYPLIGHVLLVDMLRRRMLESENASVPAVFRRRKSTFEVDVHCPFCDHSALISTPFLASFRERVSGTEKCLQHAESHCGHALFVAKAVKDEVAKTSARSRKRDVAMGYHRTTQPSPVSQAEWAIRGNPAPPDLLPVANTATPQTTARQFWFDEDEWSTLVREEKKQRGEIRKAAIASVLTLKVPKVVSDKIVGYTSKTWFGGEFERRVRAMQNLERKLRLMQAAKRWSSDSN
jgi:hypothetical protein